MASKPVKRRSMLSQNTAKDKQPSVSENLSPTGSAPDLDSVFGPPLLAQEQLEQLLDLKDLNLLIAGIAEALNLNDYHCSMKETCILDCYVIAVVFCQKQSFPIWLVSAFLTAFKSLLDAFANSPEAVSDTDQVLARCESIMADLIACAASTSSQQRQVDIDELTKHLAEIQRYLSRTFVQHQRLFLTVFSEYFCREQRKVFCNLHVGNPHPELANAACPFPPPLDEALEEQTWIRSQPRADDEEEKQTESGGVEDGDREDGEQVLQPDSGRVQDLLAQIPTERIRQLVQEVSEELLEPYQVSIEQKLRDKQAGYMQKISSLRQP